MRNRRIYDEAVERLLTGDFADPGSIDDHSVRPLADLLAAASAPARTRELADEGAAVDAFRYARCQPTSARHAPPARGRGWWLLSLKGVAIASAVATAGLALAASTGVLPNPIIDVDSPTVSGDNAAPPTSPSAMNASGLASTSASPGVPSPGASSSLVGLCHAYLAHVTNGDVPSDSPLFVSLAIAARGEDKVIAFCERVLSTHTANPSEPPSAHPTAKPSKAGEES